MKIQRMLSLVAGLALTSAALAAVNQPVVEAQANTQALLKEIQSEAMVKQGKALYTQCAACHGDQGKGDGPGGAALNPKPRNFHANEAWKNGRTFYGFYKTLEEGLAGTSMTAYKHLPAKDRVAIIQYITSIAKVPALTEDEIKKLEKDFELSKSMADKGKKALPAEVAIKKLIEEAAAENNKTQDALAYLDKHRSEPGARLFWTVTYDGEKALLTLLRNSLWKNGLNDFSQVVVRNAEQNGFRAQAGRLTQSEWQTLFAYLKKLVG